MVKVEKILLLTLFLMLSLSSFADSEKYEDLNWLYDDGYHNFEYVGWLYGDETYKLKVSIEQPTKGWLIYGNDVIENIEYCEPSSKFYCFFSRSLAFSVPKNGFHRKEWVVRGVEFKVIERSISIMIFGTHFNDLYMIESPANATLVGKNIGKPTYWLYSQEYGVVGFGLSSIPNNNSTVYWLTGGAGFANHKGQSLTNSHEG